MLSAIVLFTIRNGAWSEVVAPKSEIPMPLMLPATRLSKTGEVGACDPLVLRKIPTPAFTTMFRSIWALLLNDRISTSVVSIVPRFESPMSGLAIAKPLISVGMPGMDPVTATTEMLLPDCVVLRPGTP